MLGTAMSVAKACDEDGCHTEKRDPCSSPPCKRLKQASLPFQVIANPQEVTRTNDHLPNQDASANFQSFTADQGDFHQCRQSDVSNSCNSTTSMDIESVVNIHLDASSKTNPPLSCTTPQSRDQSPVKRTSTNNSDTSSSDCNKSPSHSLQSVASHGSILNFIQSATSGPQLDDCITPLKECENMVLRKLIPPDQVVSQIGSSSSEQGGSPNPASTPTSQQKLIAPRGRTPGRKLSVEEKLWREEQKLQKQKEKENLEQERIEKRKEKERIKMEKKKQRQEAKEKKEQERLEQLAQKQQREKEKQEKKEIEEKEKRERMEKKDEERKKREEEKKRKEDEKNLRNEEKRKKEEEQMLKKQKIKSNFANFFIKKEISSMPKQKELVKNESRFQPFELKPFMKLANTKPCKSLSKEAREAFNKVLSEQITTSIHQVKEELQKMKAELACERQMHDKPANVMGDLQEGDGDIILIEDDFPDGKTTKAKDKGKDIKPKLLQFHDNYRPAYFGTWRKKSSYIGPRTPFKKDKDLMNYDVDSDEEWEEEEPGESLSNSEGEEEDNDGNDNENDGEHDGFFVPHGYLSEGEGVDDIEDEEIDEKDGQDSEKPQEHKEEDRMERQLAKQKAWEAEMKRQFQPMKPVAIGCFWTGDIPSILKQLEACCLGSSLHIDPCIMSENTVTNSPNNNPATYCNTAMPVPEKAMPSLIKLVHANTAGLRKLMRMFRKKWTLETKDEISESNWEEHCSISKRQLERKITTIAKKEIRPTMPKARWYVHDKVLAQYNMEDISLQSNGLLDCNSQKTSPWRKIGSTPPIKRFTQNVKNSLFPGQNGINVQVESPELDKENLMDTSPL